MLWIRPLMPRLSEKLLLLVMLAAVAAGCKPKVGDDCKLSTDCSAAGDRLCDITAPGGYCTIYNCEPGTCPQDESLCVEFGAQRSPNVACQDLQSPSPYGRAFCMATCEKDSDCRVDYTCADLSAEDNAWGALLIDHDRGHRACVVPVSAAKVPGVDDQAMGNVCRSTLPDTTAADVPGQGGAGG
jgi:hypothetical protein